MTLEIIPYDCRFKQVFYDLNIAWISSLFAIEDLDEHDLSNPETSLLAKGGEIYFALQDGEPIGTVALKNTGEGRFELSKLAVAKNRRGSGAGEALCRKVIERFLARDGKNLFLFTNDALENAIRLYWRTDFVHLTSPVGCEYERANCYMEWQRPEPLEQPSQNASA